RNTDSKERVRMRAPAGRANSDHRSSLRRSLSGQAASLCDAGIARTRSQGRTDLSSAQLRKYLLEGFGVKNVFYFLDTCVQRLRRVVAHHRDLALRNDVAVIDLLVDVVNGHPCPFLVSRKRLFPCFQAWELRQKRWVNVHNS